MKVGRDGGRRPLHKLIFPITKRISSITRITFAITELTPPIAKRLLPITNLPSSIREVLFPIARRLLPIAKIDLAIGKVIFPIAKIIFQAAQFRPSIARIDHTTWGPMHYRDMRNFALCDGWEIKSRSQPID